MADNASPSEWARLHHDDQMAESDAGLSAGWHLWARRSHFPPGFGPGFRYLVTDEVGGQQSTTTEAVVVNFLDFVSVVSLQDAYAKARAKLGDIGLSLDSWLQVPYNVDREDRRLFVAWTYEARQIEPVDVGSFSGTFTGWKRLT
jgi:hypothetical protein